ncbi:MAG: DUF1566 domain-containing protein [Bacteroidales bacterium]|jgi:hypothetical protein|nr:DUF1566 domain-containing protein [Bacteroidales bacterium]
MKTNFRLLFVLGFFMTIPGLNSFSQVSISTDNSSAHSSAMLEVKATDKGFLPPRIALSAINSASPVASPATGLLVYNTATAGISPNNVIPGYYYWNGIIWVSLTPPQGTSPGDMLFWNGSQWEVVPFGSPGQFLQLSQLNVPTWSGAAFASLTTDDISSVTSTAAISGGNITSDGGAEVTARGVCWSTSSNPTIADSHTSNGGGTGTFTSNLTGLTGGSLYYVRAYATNSVGTAYGNELNFATPFAIGQIYGGGIIFYVDGTGQHGLIASAADQSTSITWYNGEFIITNATGTATGTGNSNTNIIVAAQGEGEYAAKICEGLDLNDYSDWFLPSMDELNAMYVNLKAAGVGGFADNYYFSSTEWGIWQAMGQNFSDGAQLSLYKHSPFYVRAIRAF